MGDFHTNYTTGMTLEAYRALDAAGKITRPITWPRVSRNVTPAITAAYANPTERDSSGRG